jgi:erythromycin esterase-like protein
MQRFTWGHRLCCHFAPGVIALLAITLAVFSIGQAPLRAELSVVTEWMKSNAQPFETCAPSDRVDDLAPLRRIVGDARIVALGEGTHGTREFFQLKHRITQYLASEMGFTVFAIEANLPEAWRLNDYVLGGPGNPRQLIAGMYFWTWNTEEVLEMVDWMRRFNASKRGRIEFTGFDMQAPDTAAAIVRRFLAVHEPAWAESMAVVRQEALPDPGFVTATGTLPAAEFAGHRVRYSGFIRTENVSSFAGLWMRADAGSQHAVAFDNMQEQMVKGTVDWKRYAIELTIPANTDNIYFGVLMAKEGTAWFDSLAIELDGRPWANDAFDLALENADGPRGLTNRVMHPRFSIAMDEAVARSGARSLRLTGGPERWDPDAGRRAEAAARRLVDHLEVSRDRLGEAGSPAEVDWIIRNAHVVLQHAISKKGVGMGVRDSCMAANVEWIVDEARKGSKVVLWAHNAHVAKQRGCMGKWLADRYGEDMIVVGFATNEGVYTAVKGGKLVSENALKPGPAESIESFAHETGLPRFLLDLRTARENPEVEKLLRPGVLMRSIGAVAMDFQFMHTPVLDRYDVLAWIDRTEATRPLGGAWGASKK